MNSRPFMLDMGTSSPVGCPSAPAGATTLRLHHPYPPSTPSLAPSAAACPLLRPQAGLQRALQHPHDLPIRVTVRLDINTGPDAPPHEHCLITGENAADDLFAALLLR